MQEKQNKLSLEKKKKEKKEEEEYKKKVKAQIAKDRENQIAARKAEKERKVLESQRNEQSNKPSGSAKYVFLKDQFLSTKLTLSLVFTIIVT